MAIAEQDNFRMIGAKSLDDKYLKNGLVPYVSTSEVNTLIPQAERTRGLKVLIGEQLYWYANGITNSDLVPFGTYIKTGTGDMSYLAKAGEWLKGFALKTDQGVSGGNFKIGTSPGAGDIYPGGDLTANQTETFVVDKFMDADTTYYFSGLGTGNITLRIAKA